jgi:hypothetical protein
MDEQGKFFDLPFDLETWREYGREVIQQNAVGAWRADRRSWRLGEWLVAGEEELKQRKLRREAEETTGYPWGTLKNFLWVAKEFPQSRRRDKLSWSHHREVAKLPKEEQDKFLDACIWERDGKTRVKALKYLRASIRGGAKSDLKKWEKEKEAMARVRDSEQATVVRKKAWAALGVAFDANRVYGLDVLGSAFPLGEPVKLTLTHEGESAEFLRFLCEAERQKHGKRTAQGFLNWLFERGLVESGIANGLKERRKAFVEALRAAMQPES